MLVLDSKGKNWISDLSWQWRAATTKKSLEIFRASESSRMRWMSRMNRDYRENDRKLPKKCQRTLSDSRSSAGLRAKELLCFCTWWDLKLGWCPPNGPRDWETLQESWDLGKIWVLFPLSQHLGCRNLFRTAVNYPDYPKSIHHANPSNSTSHDLLKDVKKHEERKLRELMYFSQPNTILPSVCPSWKVSLMCKNKTTLMQFPHVTSFQNPSPGRATIIKPTWPSYA